MADKIVDIGGGKVVAFPGSMSDDQIAAAIKGQMPQAAAPPQQPQAARGWLDEVGDFAKAAWSQVDPVEMVKGVVTAAGDLPGAAKGYLDSNEAIARRAEESFKKGDYAAGTRHVMGYLMQIIPGLGAGADEAGNDVQQGKVAKGLGKATGLGLGMAVPVRLPKAATITKGLKQAAPVRAAMEFAERRGVPVDLATSSDNAFVRGAQQVASSSIGGSIPAAAGKRAQGAAMVRVSGEMAGAVHPSAVTAESAGQAVRTAIEGKVGKLKGQADIAYGEFRAAAEDPKNLKEVEVGRKIPEQAAFDLDQLAMGQAQKPYAKLSEIERQHVDRLAKQLGIDTTPQPVMGKIALPVDMRPIKQALRSQYEQMQQWMEPARRNASQGIQALKSIVEGPDFRPAADAEMGLSGLKELAREAPSADLRNVSQGVGANATKLLQEAVDAAAANGSPEALKALQKGRAAHASKMELADTLKQLREEPVQAFGQAIWQKDTGIDFLRKLAKEAPAEMSKVGRAYLEGLFEKATAEGGFGHGRMLYSQWQQLGPETKRVLFKNPAMIQDLDNFFLLAKRMADVPNPSGTAPAMMAGRAVDLASAAIGGSGNVLGAVASQVGPAALASLMYSPKFVRALHGAIKIPLRSPARAGAVANLLRIAGERSQLPPNAQLSTAPAQ